MATRVSLRTKLIWTAIPMAALPLLILGALVLWQNGKMVSIASEECTTLAYDQLDHIVQGVYANCAAQEELLQHFVNNALEVGRHQILAGGGIKFDAGQPVAWDAENQLTHEKNRVSLPRMCVGDTWLGQNADAKAPSVIVDEVRKLAGVTCTFFQRMNERGDMLRVCTNVVSKEDKRAISTYIPAAEEDGRPNPVIAKLLNKEPFRGMAFVVDRWYVTAYEPLTDAQGAVTGALFVGVRQESGTALRDSIRATKVGKTGYVFVLNGQGRTKGQYVVSQGGKRDGENIWEAKDAGGRLFIQEMCEKTVALKPGEIAEMQYPWKNQDDPAPRMKVVRLMYFAPWDWVIGAGSYVDEFHAARNRMQTVGRTSNMILGGVLVATLVLTTLIWLIVARGLTRRIAQVAFGIQSAADQVTAASGQVASSSEAMAEGATEQASSIEESSAALHELSAMVGQNASNTQQANAIMNDTRQVAEEGGRQMTQMTSAIGAIKKSSDETAKIVKTIEEVAFQTNLLALNAAVEAARAGEAGKGFAVVAEEVRNLAQRSAQAAKSTAQLITDSQQASQNGVQVTQELARVLDSMQSSVNKVGALVSEIAAASKEQAQGVDQISTTISQMSQVTQSNAANAEESAASGEELAGQAHELQAMVLDLLAVVHGNHGVDQHEDVEFENPPTVNRRRQPEARPLLPFNNR